VKGEREKKCMRLRTEKKKKKKEDVASFFTKIITFRPLVCPDRFLFRLAQIARGDAFQDMLRAIQNFFIF